MAIWEFIHYLAWVMEDCPVDTSVVELDLTKCNLHRILTEVGLKTLTSKISNLPNLRKLNISHNKLTTIPAEISELSKLRTLDVSHNKLTTIPSSIGNLPNLKTLKLSHNLLTTIPTIKIRKLYVSKSNPPKKEIMNLINESLWNPKFGLLVLL